MSAATVYLVSACAYTAVGAWGWLSRRNRDSYRGLVVAVTCFAALLWVAAGATR